VTVYMGWRRV